jgi:hypothetical protein
MQFTAKPGSKLAASVAELGQGKSVLANLSGPDTALSGRGFLALPQNLRKAWDAMLDEAMKIAVDKAPDKTARELIETGFKAIRPTLKAAEVDAAFELRGPQENRKYTVLTGFAIKEGEEIEKAIRAVHKELPPEIRRVFMLDAEKVGSVSVHKIVPPGRIDANLRQLLGDEPPFYVAVRKDVVFLAAGDKALDALKDVLAREPKQGRLIHLEGSAVRLASLDKKEDTAALAAKVFAKDKDADRVRLTLDGGKTLELRLSAKAKLLELVVKVIEMRNRGEE